MATNEGRWLESNNPVALSLVWSKSRWPMCSLSMSRDREPFDRNVGEREIYSRGVILFLLGEVRVLSFSPRRV